MSKANPIKNAISIYLCLLLIVGVLLSGCDSGDKKESASGGDRLENSTSGMASDSKMEDAATTRPFVQQPPVPKVTVKPADRPAWEFPFPKNQSVPIDQIIDSDRVSDATREAARIRKRNGVKSLTARSLGIFLDQFDIDVAIENRLQTEWPPIQSKFDSPSEFQYDTNPTSTAEWLEGFQTYIARPVAHFRQRKINGLNETEQNEIADLIFRVLIGDGKGQSTERIADLQNELKAAIEKYPVLRGDPLFYHCAGIQFFRAGDISKAYSSLTIACSLYAASDYPALSLALARFAILRVEKKSASQTLRNRNLARCFVAYNYWLAEDFRATPAEHRFACAILTDFMDHLIDSGDWELLDRFVEMVNRQQHIPIWIRSIVNGKYHTKIAWRRRGGGYISTVSEEALKFFEKHQEIALQHYRKAYEANPMFPEAAAELIDICKTWYDENENEERTEQYWFEKAIEAQADFTDAYWSRLHSLLPQWGGSVESMLEFADASATGGDDRTAAPYAMVQFYYCGLRNLRDPQDRQFHWKKENVSKVMKALETLIEEERSLFIGGRIRGRNMFLTQKATIAFLAEQYETAREALDRLGSEFDADRSYEVTTVGEEVIRGRGYALTDEKIADDAKELYQLYLDGKGNNTRNTNAKEIISSGTELLEKTENEYAKSWIRRIRDKTQFESEYDLGLSAVLPFDKGLTLWKFSDKSHFQYESEDSIILDTSKSVERPNAISFLTCPGPKSVEFDIEFLDSDASAREKVLFTPSVNLLNYRRSPFSIGLNRLYKKAGQKPEHVFDLGQLSFGYRDGESPPYNFQVELEEFKNRLRFNAMPGYYEVFLNDRFIFRSRSDYITSVASVFEITQPRSRNGRGKVRISGIRIEKWTSPIPPIQGTPQELVDHYQNELEVSPDDQWTAFCLAQATHQKGDFEKAIDLYRNSVILGISVEDAAFFLGDCHDRLGERDEAIAWYKKAAKASAENMTKLYPRTGMPDFTNSCHWAAFRLGWLKYTHPDAAIRKELAEFQSCRADHPINMKWAVGLLNAIEKLSQGKLNATACFQDILNQCPDESKSHFQDAIAQLEASGTTVVGVDETPLYLKFEDSIPFFRCFGDYLDPAWNGVYSCGLAMMSVVG